MGEKDSGHPEAVTFDQQACGLIARAVRVKLSTSSLESLGAGLSEVEA